MGFLLNGVASSNLEGEIADSSDLFGEVVVIDCALLNGADSSGFCGDVADSSDLYPRVMLK